ncbi:hypothetical protein [Chryseobacterium sp. ERMR1:04]|uniref:hypothetical protein n=1 Tax=Chryseobacterium sp. ERMR1:04 TaxID=1705393 RepID=UPI0006C893F9|nr:hypothetical protein [Chryseobacterium sp. ERMR1:04]KPH13394.1 hypothetical protein AMQ68_13205 [Chryseobacterium sp. ERMR1:04]
MPHKFVKEDISVTDKFIIKFSEMYIKQRSETRFEYGKIDESLLFQKHGFDSTQLQHIIKRNSVAEDLVREAGNTHKHVITDIYRSDLGELLLTYYFEDKLPKNERFIIPHKNITNRELAGQPGRGLDAIGYRIDNDRLRLMIGEGKVSQQKKNPPSVVDYNNDSIFNTQTKFKNDRDLLINRLSDYTRNLTDEAAEKIGLVLLLLEFDKQSDFDLVFGCALIRDVSCVKINDDYGKFYTQQTDFDPHNITFCVLNFDKEISETIDLFYEKVQELCKA